MTYRTPSQALPRKLSPIAEKRELTSEKSMVIYCSLATAVLRPRATQR